ncbi:hypothetical protein F4801DRAFT_604241 [Xylaria longipes]|nr:hypothetical protein F4801DRAFT_604241 [Xylaria longipes]
MHPSVDDDSTSGVPNPNREPGMSKRHILSAYRQATFLLETGELEDAELLFTELSKSHVLREQPLEKIHIDMQIAAVKMYRGHYKQSREDLDKINERLKYHRTVEKGNKWTDELQYLCRQRLANCQLLAGRWDKAAEIMQSHLKEDLERYHVRLRRDIALSYAYLGQYGKARECLKFAQEQAKSALMVDSAGWDAKVKARLTGQDTTEIHQEEDSGTRALDDQQSRLERETRKELQIKEGTVKVAMATVDMLAGEYMIALAASSDAQDLMKNMLGAKHFKTLAVATLKAWCLAYGKYGEAETLCLTTYKAMAGSLGLHHPQTLEAMGCLVYIFERQGRFAEAIGTGVSLDSLSTEWKSESTEWVTDVGYYHPQATHSKFLLATAFLASGEYAASKLIIDEVVDQAARAMGMKHPETLRYRSEQARALLYLGNVSEARNLASLVAGEKFELYTCNEWMDVCKTWGIGPHEECLSRLNNLLNRVLEEKPLSSTTLHPFLVSTLQLVANIEVREYRLTERKDEYAGLATARAMLTKLQSYYSSMEPRSIVLTSSINLDSATLCKEHVTQSGDLSKAIEPFTQAYENRKSYMGDNIDTLCTLRELTIAQCLRDLQNPDTEVIPIDRVKTVSDSILKTLESRLGLAHPETLTSQLWCLTVDHLLPENDSSITNKIVEDLIENLSDPRVIKKRLVESLVMKRQLASLLNGMGNYEEARGVVDGAVSELDKVEAAKENESLKETLLDLKATFLELQKTVDNNRQESEAIKVH